MSESLILKEMVKHLAACGNLGLLFKSRGWECLASVFFCLRNECKLQETMCKLKELPSLISHTGDVMGLENKSVIYEEISIGIM